MCRPCPARVLHTRKCEQPHASTTMAWDARDWHRCIVNRGGQSIIAAAARGGLLSVATSHCYTELHASYFKSFTRYCTHEGPRQQVMLACRVLYSLPFQKFEEFIVSKYLNSDGERLPRRGCACGNAAGSPSIVHGCRLRWPVPPQVLGSECS